MLVYAGGVVAGKAVPRGQLPDLSDTPSSSWVDPKFTQVVGADVYCWSHADWRRRTADLKRRWPDQERLGAWRGYTSYVPVVSVHVSPEICSELTRLGRLAEPVWEDGERDALAWSVSALAHESVHVRGEPDEAKADCYGMQSIRRTALELGRSAEEGQYLAERYWKRWYRWSKPPYHSRECRNGGRLDLRPRTDVWP